MRSVLATMFLLGLAPFASAQTIETFVIPANDGYGVDTCLAAGGECARLVATAWCVSNGYGRSVSVRHAEPTDMIGATPLPVAIAAAPAAAVVVSCEK